MADVVDKATRSRMMSGIRSKDTKPELLIRSALHKLGLRYRLHVRDLPGKPDLVFPKYRSVIFVHGCFWHGHNCRYFKWPGTRAEFWRRKILENCRRDTESNKRLKTARWRSTTVWECELKGQTPESLNVKFLRIRNWIVKQSSNDSLAG